MQGKSLYDFYEHAVLPQFGVAAVGISWSGSQNTGPDESVHYFSVGGSDFALIFEDYDGLGRNDAYIRENVLEHHVDYEFVNPASNSGCLPSYDGFRLPAPSKYCKNVTGNFTLIKLL
jgi:hypothetical protein